MIATVERVADLVVFASELARVRGVPVVDEQSLSAGFAVAYESGVLSYAAGAAMAERIGASGDPAAAFAVAYRELCDLFVGDLMAAGGLIALLATTLGERCGAPAADVLRECVDAARKELGA